MPPGGASTPRWPARPTTVARPSRPTSRRRSRPECGPSRSGNSANSGGSISDADQVVLEYMETLSNWGRWGADDTLGTLNLVDDGKRTAAAALIRTGRVVSCSREVSPRHHADNPDPLV